jgi:hypothetical protein
MVMHDYVVILHGIFRTKRHMRKLAAYVASQGYDVVNLNYPSTKYPLEELAEITWHNISAALKIDKPVHFVGYSMGGLLLRVMLGKYRPDYMGRVVHLATPNGGSEVADFLKNNWLYQKLYGPAGQQLITDQSAIAHLFNDIDYECGVIAGSMSVDPFCSYFICGQNDGKVSIERTKIDGMQDHIIIHSTHTWFPHNKEVQQQTVQFIREGMFKQTRGVA